MKVQGNKCLLPLQTVRHGFPYQPTALAFDPVQKILAIGSRSGGIRMYPFPFSPLPPVCCGANDDSANMMTVYTTKSSCLPGSPPLVYAYPSPSVLAANKTGGQGTQVGADSLIHTVALGCLRGPRCCWQVLNGRTERDVTGARWRLISWGIMEELRVDYMIRGSKCGCLIFLSLPSLESASLCCCNERLAENEAFTWMEALEWLSICIDMQLTLSSPPLWPVTV